jgi:hypothetical protein
MSNIIQTRDDLEQIKGTEEYSKFMALLKGSMIRRQDVQLYPEGYNTPEYEGPNLEPIWEDVEDLSTIQRFGFDKKDFE